MQAPTDSHGSPIVNADSPFVDADHDVDGRQRGEDGRPDELEVGEDAGAAGGRSPASSSPTARDG